jgi:hypothetical protein
VTAAEALRRNGRTFITWPWNRPLLRETRHERKNPALSSDHYRSLTRQLQYFDLHELQDTITNKALWSEFESRFGTKEALAARFGQLAGLRNAIRHSRTVDEITRTDGEAALL